MLHYQREIILHKANFVAKFLLLLVTCISLLFDRVRSYERPKTLRKYRSAIFLGSNEPATSLTIIDFRPSRLAMLNFSRNEWRTRARTKSSGLGRGEKFRVERFTDFLSHSERERENGTQLALGKCSSDIVFPFRSTKAARSNFANATKSGCASHLLSVAVILLETFARAEKHSLNCRRERRRRWRIFELRERERELKRLCIHGFAV